LLALASYESGEDVARGWAFLARTPRKDVGWPPHPSIGQSTWGTAMALLALAGRPGATGSQDADGWSMRRSGRKSGHPHRLREWRLGVRLSTRVLGVVYDSCPETTGLAFLAHARTPPPSAPIPPAFRKLIGTVLFIAAQGAAGGRNVFPI
jgi:hypothetical protein